MNIKPLLRALLNHIAAFAPVMVFLLYGRQGVGNAATRWEIAYLLGGALSLPHMIWLLLQLQPLGTCAVLGSVFATGIAATFFSPQGFIGKAHADSSKTTRASLQLVGVAALAMMLAALFRYNPVLGGALPVAAIALARGKLARQLT